MYGTPIGTLAKKYNLDKKTIQTILSQSPCADEVGFVPEEKQRACYKSYLAIAEPILRARGVTWAQFFSDCRLDRFCWARFEIWAALKDSGKSYPLIGAFSNRHHTTVMHGVQMWRLLGADRQAAE